MAMADAARPTKFLKLTSEGDRLVRSFPLPTNSRDTAMVDASPPFSTGSFQGEKKTESLPTIKKESSKDRFLLPSTSSSSSQKRKNRSYSPPSSFPNSNRPSKGDEFSLAESSSSSSSSSSISSSSEGEAFRACTRCRKSSSSKWRLGPEGQYSLCNSCGLKYLEEARKIHFDYLVSICVKHKEPLFPPGLPMREDAFLYYFNQRKEEEKKKKGQK